MPNRKENQNEDSWYQKSIYIQKENVFTHTQQSLDSHENHGLPAKNLSDLGRTIRKLDITPVSVDAYFHIPTSTE